MTTRLLSKPASKTLVVGIDEAGRGAIAGPVVAGACVLDGKKWPVKIGDSKQMTREQREESFEWIIQHCIYGIGSVDAPTIDRIGIMAANEIAMQQAVAQISREHKNLYLLVDGRDAYWFDHPHSSVIHGDAIEPCIGAASILAKVTRDRWIIEAAREFPLYGFDGHKGYGSPEHQECIRKHGFSEIHRRTFCRNIEM